MDASRHDAGGTAATAAEARPRAGEGASGLPLHAPVARVLPSADSRRSRPPTIPGKLAAVVFAQGCPWRCGYCHNPHLLPSRAWRPSPNHAVTDWRDVLDWLQTRRGLLDAVVFSGGEPTAQAALVDAVREVAQLGFTVGLHTGGAYPRRLAALLPALGWVGFDLKATRDDYAALTGVTRSGIDAFVALDLLCESGTPFEVPHHRPPCRDAGPCPDEHRARTGPTRRRALGVAAVPPGRLRQCRTQ